MATAICAVSGCFLDMGHAFLFHVAQIARSGDMAGAAVERHRAVPGDHLRCADSPVRGALVAVGALITGHTGQRGRNMHCRLAGNALIGAAVASRASS